MQNERPEYPETKRARWKAYIAAAAAFVVPGVMAETGRAEAAPYAFAMLFATAVYLFITLETDRLHRRIDALRDRD